jgi:hypothetical protein
MKPSLPLLALLALAACKGDDPKAVIDAKLPPLNQALPRIVLPANTAMVSYNGSEDAVSLLYRSASSRENVEGFYRVLLTREGWRLVSEATDNQGATVFHATQDGPPLWVRVWPDTAFNATYIQMSGAVRKLGAPGVPGAQEKPVP